MNAILNPKICNQISLIMNDIEAISKSRKNLSQGYNFRGIDEIYNELHPILAKHKVFSTSEILDQHREERPTKSGGMLQYTILKIKFRFYTDDGSYIETVVIGEGSDSGDKSTNKAMAIAHKYALMQIFAIPTEGDNDGEAQKPEFIPRQNQPQQSPPHGDVSKPMTGPSEPMLKRLFAIAMSSNYTKEAVTKILQDKFKISSSKELNRKSYDELCKFLETNPVKPDEKEDNIPF